MAKKRKVIDMGAPMMDRKWQAESDLRTLMDAAAIRDDPKRFKAAQNVAKDKLAEMEDIVQGKGEMGPKEDASDKKKAG